MSCGVIPPYMVIKLDSSAEFSGLHGLKAIGLISHLCPVKRFTGQLSSFLSDSFLCQVINAVQRSRSRSASLSALDWVFRRWNTADVSFYCLPTHETFRNHIFGVSCTILHKRTWWNYMSFAIKLYCSLMSFCQWNLKIVEYWVELLKDKTTKMLLKVSYLVVFSCLSG